jgi:phenol hydroxylase P1 protein
MLSRVGIALGRGTGDVLTTAKQEWLDGEHLQPLRRLTEEIMVVDDWAEGLLAIDHVDSMLYPLVYSGLDERALLGGAGAYSLFAQHLSRWFADQRKWIDALLAAWQADPEHGPENKNHLDRIDRTWKPRALEAAADLSAVIAERLDGAVA